MNTKKVKARRHEDPVTGRVKVKATREVEVVASAGESVTFEVEGSDKGRYYLLFFDDIFENAPMSAPGEPLPVTLTVARDAQEGEYDYVVHARFEDRGRVLRAIAEGGSSPRIVIRR